MEVFTGAGRRRSWSAAEKAAIIAERYGTGETVCSVARHHGLTPQQLFTWRSPSKIFRSIPEISRPSLLRYSRYLRRSGGP